MAGTTFPTAVDTLAGFRPAGSNGATEDEFSNNVAEAVIALETLAQGTGYTIKRGVHQIAAAQDTIATGLATVIAVIVSLRDAPTINIMFIAASIGDQNGAPVAGSFLLNSYKPTASGNVTPAAATTFSDNINVNWIAVGT